MIESGEEIARSNDLGKMLRDFIHQMQPDRSSKCVAFFEVNAWNGQVSHPLFWLICWRILFHVFQNFVAQSCDEVLQIKKTNSVNILNILFEAEVSVSYAIVVCGFKLNNNYANLYFWHDNPLS